MGVFRCGNFFLRLLLLYLILYFGFLWFFICKWFIIFCILSYIKLYGLGKGSGFLVMWSLFRLYILLYVMIMFFYLFLLMFFSCFRRYWIVIKKIWLGFLDLWWMLKYGNDINLMDSLDYYFEKGNCIILSSLWKKKGLYINVVECNMSWYWE